MGKIIINIGKILFASISLLYAEKYYFKFLNIIGINVSELTVLTKDILLLIMYIVLAVIIYFFYKEKINYDLKRFKRRMFSNILLTIVFFIGVAFIVSASEHLSSVLASSFKVSYEDIKHINIFNINVNLNLVIFVIKNIILIPIIKTVIIVLGSNDLFSGKKTILLASGLIGSAFHFLNIDGSFLFIVFNTFPFFTLYVSLAYIYQKNNKNISFSIMTYILYNLLAGPLLDRIL